jgi:hypothetical protein
MYCKVLRRALAAVVLFTLELALTPALSADSATTSFGRSLFAVLDDSDPLIRSYGWNSLAWLGTASNPNTLHTAAFERFLNNDRQALLRHMETLLADVLAHCRAMAAFCRQRVAASTHQNTIEAEGWQKTFYRPAAPPCRRAKCAGGHRGDRMGAGGEFVLRAGRPVPVRAASARDRYRSLPFRASPRVCRRAAPVLRHGACAGLVLGARSRRAGGGATRRAHVMGRPAAAGRASWI